MDAGRYNKLIKLFESASNLDPEPRRSFIDEACRDDAELRTELESLLASGDEANDKSSLLADERIDQQRLNLEKMLDAGAPPTETLAHAPVPGDARRIGPFRIKRVIASGGMGTVYEAFQEQPRRSVALKLMRSGIASRSALRRFEYESQILARLRHAGIAQVFQAGTHQDGGVTVPYFAMEYIPNAKTIIEYASQKRLETRERLELFETVCEAVHHGHQKGIIHRDLKPGNILVDSAGQVKVIDFGVARSTDSDMAVTTLQTDVGQLIGTLQYMSPEQCEADPNDIDIRSDVYTLGVILFELLTNKLPYDVSRAAIYEATRVIREQSPTHPSTIDRSLRGDIATITLKALEKDRDRRYESALALKEDIRRYLANEPILARSPTVTYRTRQFVRRNKTLVGGLAAVFIVLIGGIIASTTFALRAERTVKELELVVDYQQSQLEAIDPAQMGFGMRQTLERELREGLSENGVEPRGIDAALVRLDEALRAINFTDVAMATLDGNIFQRSIASIERQFANQPQLRASLQIAFARVLLKVGFFDMGADLLRQGYATQVDTLGARHPDTLVTQAELLDKIRLESIETEITLIREALPTMEEVLGVDHPATLQAAARFAIHLRDQSGGETASLIEMMQRLDRALGADNDLSINYKLTICGSWAGGDPALMNCLSETRSTVRARYGPDDPRTIKADHLFIGHLRWQGRLAEAESLCLDVLARELARYGSTHPETIESKQLLGTILEESGKLEEAEATLVTALEWARTSGLTELEGTAIVISHNLGFVHYKQGRLREAEAMIRKAWEARLQERGPNSPDTVANAGNLAMVLTDMGRLEEAEAIARDAIADASTFADPFNLRTAMVRAQLARALTAQDQFVEAEREMLESHRVMHEQLGDAHERTQRVVGWFVDLYQAWHAADPGKGYDDRAADWRAKLTTKSSG